MSLQGRFAIVTGASAGIGWAVAEELSRLGAAVVIQARRKEKLEELAKIITARGGKALVVPGDALDAFCHYCGVFAAAGLFAEIAIPTALVLSCQSIRLESETRWQGLEVWAKDEVDAMEERNQLSLATLFESFPDNQLYVHPVKLSRWS